MNQISLAQTGFELATKRTRKREFLDEMNAVIPWAALLGLLRRHAPESRMGRPPFALETMLRIHLLQQFFGLSDPAMEEALHDVPLYREFARLDVGMSRMPDESTILRFRHFLEAHQRGAALLATVNAELSRKGLLLRQGSVVDATLIAAPSLTKNQSGQRTRRDLSPWAGEEHAADLGSVCALQFVDGAQTSGDASGMSASAVWKNGGERP